MSSFSKKYSGKRKYSGTRSSFQSNSSGSAVARTGGFKMFKKSTGTPMAELKAYDTNNNAGAQTLDGSVTPFALTNGGAFRVLNAMAQGSDMQNRIGRKVTNASINVSVHIRRVADATAASDCYARIMLVWDKQPNSAGTLPPLTDLVYISTGNQQYNMIKNHNLDNRQRFVIMYDQVKHLSNLPVSDAGYNASVDVSVTKSLGRAPTQYSGNAAVSSADSVGTIATGALYLVVAGSILTANTDPGWNVYATSRLRYYDS